MSIHNSQIQIKPVFLVLRIFPTCGSLIHCSAKWWQVVVKKDLTTQTHSNPSCSLWLEFSFPDLRVASSYHSVFDRSLLPWRGIVLASDPSPSFVTSYGFIFSQHMSLSGVIFVHLVTTCPSTGMWFQKARGHVRQVHCPVLTTYAVWFLTVDW